MPTVRLADAKDAERIGEIHVRSWLKAYAGILPPEFLTSLSTDSRVERWRTDLERMEDGNLALVIEEERSVCGFARLGPSADGNDGEIRAIYLDPDRWRRGLGRALMAAAEESLAESGWKEAILWVLERNLSARRFYEAVGWRLESHRALLNIGGADVQEIRYRKAL